MFAHRCVLACRCQVFRGMLSQAPVGSQDSSSSIQPQGPFILGNVQPEVFLAVIEFLYTNSVTLNSHIVSGDGAGGDHGHGRDKKGMQGRGCFASLGVPKLEEMVCVMLSGWLTGNECVGSQPSTVGCPQHLVPVLGPLAVHTLDGENEDTTAGNLNFSPCSSLISHAPLPRGAPVEAGAHLPFTLLCPLPCCARPWPPTLMITSPSCLQALEVLTSSVEYGLQDLCKVQCCLG